MAATTWAVGTQMCWLHMLRNRLDGARSQNHKHIMNIWVEDWMFNPEGYDGQSDTQVEFWVRLRPTKPSEDKPEVLKGIWNIKTELLELMNKTSKFDRIKEESEEKACMYSDNRKFPIHQIWGADNAKNWIVTHLYDTYMHDHKKWSKLLCKTVCSNIDDTDEAPVDTYYNLCYVYINQ